MSFAKIGTDLSIKSTLDLENLFILDYMPSAPDGYTKIYIYGKLMALGQTEDSSAERMCSIMAVTEDELVSAYKYWEEQGLVKVLSTAPLEVEYLEVKHVKPSQKKFSKTKYSSFNEQLSKMFPGRSFLPSEYNEYYSCMEDNRIEPDGMLACIAYCARLKGNSIGWQYICKVASNMAGEGCHTVDDFITKIENYGFLSDNLKELFKILKIKRVPDYDDNKQYKKWTEQYGFDSGTIFEVAKTVFGEMKGLDTVLTRYYQDGLIKLTDIEEFRANHDRLLTLTKNILIKLDVRYSRLDYYADYYIKEWLKMGFTGDALLTVAEWCFRHEKKSCEKMSSELKTLADSGMTSDKTVNAKYAGAYKADETIKEIFGILKINSDVSSRDRDSYNIWVNVWNIPIDIIKKTAEKCIGEAYPKIKLSGLLKEWHENGGKAPKTKSDPKNDIIKHGDDMSSLNEKLRNIKPEDI